MTKFYDTHFLLGNEIGKKLYHEVAAFLPVIDPHNHIDPAALAADKRFNNIYELWIKQDPYKHRAMRICGIPELLITGDKPDYEKFLAWASCFTKTVGNPLFHWSVMELKQLFGIDELLTTENAVHIWETANALLKQPDYSALQIVKRFGVEMLCTSDDLLDTLEHHLALASNQHGIACLPSLRSDSILAFNQPGFLSWVQKLENISGPAITNLEAYKNAISERLNFFDKAGCLLSDHSLDSGFSYHTTETSIANALFDKVLNKTTLTTEESIGLQSHLLHFLGMEYAKRKWKMQMHIGAYRYTSSRLRKLVGPAGGFACIGKAADVQSICTFLDELDIKNELPKTILYTLNPADNAVFASLTGSYSEDGVTAKIQFGPAWWYNDHYEGITQQLNALSSYGMLSTSIGMTTDSRSILSFTRHEYFRRIVCNLIGAWVEEGKLPNNWNLLSELIKNISYYNIKNWLIK